MTALVNTLMKHVFMTADASGEPGGRREGAAPARHQRQRVRPSPRRGAPTRPPSQTPRHLMAPSSHPSLRKLVAISHVRDSRHATLIAALNTLLNFVHCGRASRTTGNCWRRASPARGASSPEPYMPETPFPSKIRGSTGKQREWPPKRLPTHCN